MVYYKETTKTMDVKFRASGEILLIVDHPGAGETAVGINQIRIK